MARQNWSRPQPIRCNIGRRPKVCKNSRVRTQEQRAFAAGVLHSILVYPGLRTHERAIKAMLCARNLLDEAQARILSTVHDTPKGVRPTPAEFTADAAEAWLDKNCFVSGCDDHDRRITASGETRVHLVNDSVGIGRNERNCRDFHSLEQLQAWVYLWADEKFELRWLGMEVGLAVFTTGAQSEFCPQRLQSVVDYGHIQDPHAMMRVGPCLDDRRHQNYTKDFVSVYGPLTLINAACDRHSSFSYIEQDFGCSGKRVQLTWKKGKKRAVDAGCELFLSYPPAKGRQFCCHALAPKPCRNKVG